MRSWDDPLQLYAFALLDTVKIGVIGGAIDYESELPLY